MTIPNVRPPIKLPIFRLTLDVSTSLLFGPGLIYPCLSFRPILPTCIAIIIQGTYSITFITFTFFGVGIRRISSFLLRGGLCVIWTLILLRTFTHSWARLFINFFHGGIWVIWKRILRKRCEFALRVRICSSWATIFWDFY